VNALTHRRLWSLPARASKTRPGWAALVAVVVLGIVGMHAIGLHGSQHADLGALAAPSSMPAMAAMAAMAEHNAIAKPSGQGEGAVRHQGEVATLVSPLDLAHGMAGMAMLCIAVLVGAALVRLLVGSQRGWRAPLRDGVMTSMRAVRRTDARQTGPPVVWAFSAVRC